MTKEEAREKLTEYLNSTRTIWNDSIQLPIFDVNICTISYDNGLNHVIETTSFKGLLKIAYDL
jgi:hypothetical protein